GKWCGRSWRDGSGTEPAGPGSGTSAPRPGPFRSVPYRTVIFACVTLPALLTVMLALPFFRARIRPCVGAVLLTDTLFVWLLFHTICLVISSTVPPEKVAVALICSVCPMNSVALGEMTVVLMVSLVTFRFA